MRIAIIEDDKRIREGLFRYISEHTENDCVLSAESIEACLPQMHDMEAPDVVLLDINLPGMSGIDGIRPLKKRWPDAAVIMLTIYNDTGHIFDALKAGADGYLLKNTPMQQIMEGLEQIHNQGAPMSPTIARKVIDFFNPPKKREASRATLTARELDMLQGLSEGLTYQQVAEKFYVSIETVRHHVKNIYSKLHVNSKVQAVTRYLRGDI